MPGQKALPAGEIFRQSAAALKLPLDTLTLTLFAFSRFFSLPPGQALFETLRREVLALFKASPSAVFSSSPKTAVEKTALEARVLAALAAFDKGVALRPEALERYARFFEPPLFAGNGEGGEKGAMQTSGGEGGGRRSDKEALPQPEEVKAAAEDEAGDDGLLDFLNSIPGKNGQYWNVFPFRIIIKGIELKIFLRILKEGQFVSGGNERIIVDIAAPQKQYRCFLKNSGGRLGADIRVYPELPAGALKSLAKKARRILGEGSAPAGNWRGFQEIRVRNGEDSPSWAEDLSAECLPSIDSEV